MDLGNIGGESRSQRIGTTVDRRKDGEAASSRFIFAVPVQISTESAPTYLTELPAHEKNLIPGQKKSSHRPRIEILSFPSMQTSANDFLGETVVRFF